MRYSGCEPEQVEGREVGVGALQSLSSAAKGRLEEA